MYKRQGQQGDQQQREQRQRLVSIIAELKLLKQLEDDLHARSEQIEKLMAARTGESGTVEAEMMDKLANRQNRITSIFLELKRQLDEMLRDPGEGEPQEPRKGR